MAHMNRRDLIATLGCSIAASPFLTPMTFAATKGENRLVVIILRGAMDGLDVVRPYGDANLKVYRPRLLSGLTGETDLDGFYAIHPALMGLMPLWRSGELSFAHAVSTPYRDKRSHFDGQDLLEAGTGLDVSQAGDGWLNRLLQNMPDATSQTAFAVGREDMKLLSGSAKVSSWSPDGRLDMSPQARLLLEEVYHDDPLFRDAGLEAVAIAESLGVASEDSFGLSKRDMRAQIKASATAGEADVLARFAANRLNASARIAAFSLSGWDTHRGQNRGITRALVKLENAILTLKRELGAHWQRTAVVAMTEFGRTVRENGTQGTDHGTGGALVMAGGAVSGGKIFGDWPGLNEADLYARRDLMPTGDARAYPAWMMQGLFSLDANTLQTSVFPGLQLGRDPGVLA